MNSAQRILHAAWFGVANRHGRVPAGRDAALEGRFITTALGGINLDRCTRRLSDLKNRDRPKWSAQKRLRLHCNGKRYNPTPKSAEHK